MKNIVDKKKVLNGLLLCRTGPYTFFNMFNYFSFSLSLTHCMVNKVLFSGQIFEMEISMDLHFLASTESKNHSFRDWSVCELG